MIQNPRRSSILPIPPESWVSLGTWSERLDFFLFSLFPSCFCQAGRIPQWPAVPPYSTLLGWGKGGNQLADEKGEQAQKTEWPQRESPYDRARAQWMLTHVGVLWGKRCRESNQEVGLRSWKNFLSQNWSLSFLQESGTAQVW